MFSIPGSLSHAIYRAESLSESVDFNLKDDSEIKPKLNELSQLCQLGPSNFMIELGRRFTFGNEEKITEINAKIEEISKLIKFKLYLAI
jgi:hypothetical protein